MRTFGALALALALLVPRGAAAEFRFQPDEVTLGLGPAMLQDGIGTTFFLAGRVDLGTFTDDLVWDAGLHWWRKTESATFDFFGTSSTTETRIRDLAVSSGVKYLFSIDHDRWVPYARGGLALNFVDVAVETTVSGTPTEAISASSSDMGAYIGGGATYRYSPTVSFGAEAVYNMTDADHFLLGFTASFLIGGGASQAAD